MPPDVCDGNYKCTCTPTTCAAQNANCGQVPDGCGGFLSCGTCSGTDSCGAGGVPYVCANALMTGCDGCPPGFPGNIVQLHNTACAPDIGGCGTEEVSQLVCAAPGVAAMAGCGITCAMGYHFAGYYTDCVCPNPLGIGVCVHD
jgi:hypothetical protein